MDARLRRHRGRNEYLLEGVQRALPDSADESRVTEFGFRTSECGFGATSSRMRSRSGTRASNSREELLTPPGRANNFRFRRSEIIRPEEAATSDVLAGCALNDFAGEI